MKNKLKIIFLSGLVLSLGACTNIQDTFNGATTYTDVEKNNFNVQEETQLFDIGNYRINESGPAVAKMKAEEQAKTHLKKQIFNETTNILTSFVKEINTKSVLISSNTIKDLSNLISSELMKGATITNSWKNEDKEFIVLAIDKNKISDKVKKRFITHLQNIIDNLDSTIYKVSNEYSIILDPSISVKKEKTSQVIESQTKTITPENLNPQNILNNLNSEKNSESEVFLDDF